LLTTNRARHLPTICGVTENRAATSLFGTPSAHAITIFDRSASACEVFARRTHCSSTCRSSSASTSGGSGRPIFAMRQVYYLYMELITQDTRSACADVPARPGGAGALSSPARCRGGGQAGPQAERGEVRGIHQSVGSRSPAG